MAKRPLNVCEDCQYTWHPRGKNLSPTCPRCGSQNTKIKPSSCLSPVIISAIVIGLLAVAVMVCVGGGLIGLVQVAKTPSPPSLRLTRPAALPLASPTWLPTPLPAPSPTPLVLGGQVEWRGLALGVTRQEVTRTCPGGEGQAAEGAKFVIVQVVARNVSTDVIEIPHLDIELNGYQSGLGAGLPCRYNQEAFGNACWQWSGKLYPDVSCEGWLLFEVPEKLPLEQATVKLQIYDPSEGFTDIAEWWLK